LVLRRLPCGSNGIKPIRRCETNDETQFREDLRFRILRLLQSDPKLSNREIAKQLGVSVGGVHYCLKALANKGMIKIHNFRASDKKLQYAYVVTPKGISEKALLASRFLQRKMVEYDALRAEIEAISEEVRTQENREMGPKA
jgi:EPS-associated MarR family transcriptional regulator